MGADPGDRFGPVAVGDHLDVRFRAQNADQSRASQQLVFGNGRADHSTHPPLVTDWSHQLTDDQHRSAAHRPGPATERPTGRPDQRATGRTSDRAVALGRTDENAVGRSRPSLPRTSPNRRRPCARERTTFSSTRLILYGVKGSSTREALPPERPSGHIRRLLARALPVGTTSC